MKKKYLLLTVFWLAPAECMERSISVEDFSQALYDDKKEIIQSWLTMAKAGKIDVNAQEKDRGSTALIQAVNRQNINVEVVRELLNVPGIDVNAKDKEGYTALIIKNQ